MQFINLGELTKVRKEDEEGRYYWISLKKGGIVDLPESVGLRYGFAPYVEAEEIPIIAPTPEKVEDPGDKIVEIDVKYFEKLIKIKGIGKKTVGDIVHVYPTAELLKLAVRAKEELPFRDDISKRLKRKFRR